MESPPAESQHASRSFFDELRHLLRLAAPIAFVQLGMMAMNHIDLTLLGRHDELSLPSMALGNTLSWAASVFCMGMVTATDPLLSQAVGARDRGAVARLLGRGVLLCLALAVPAGLLLLPAEHWLQLFGQPPALIPEAGTYARLQALGLLPLLCYSLLRSLLSAHARLWPQVMTIIVGNLANLGLDWLLIFGNLGLPELGATGAAITTVSCRWLMLLALCWLGRRDLAPHLRQLRHAETRRRALALAPLLRLMRLGVPVGLQFTLEIGVFAATALLIGYFDARAGDANTAGPSLSGHQIAVQFASLSFMVPLGIGMAASVRVGWAVGRGEMRSVRRSAMVALIAGSTVMGMFMLAFLLLPTTLAATLSRHEDALAIAATLIPIAGVFQIGDGLQVVAIGCLRGLGDVRSPVIANAIGFWLIGLPTGLLLAFGLGLGPAGLWWGLVIGLSLVAAALLYVLRKRTAENRTRLDIE